jgi:hypothetical protein
VLQSFAVNLQHFSLLKDFTKDILIIPKMFSSKIVFERHKKGTIEILYVTYCITVTFMLEYRKYKQQIVIHYVLNHTVINVLMCIKYWNIKELSRFSDVYSVVIF